MLEVFNAFTDPAKVTRFNKTVIRVGLMQHEGEALLSRSQAKRLMARVEKLTEADLDFKNVQLIGQAFADEIFRVFANVDVERMIRRVTS